MRGRAAPPHPRIYPVPAPRDPHIEVVVTLVAAFFGTAVEVDSPNVQGYAKKGDNAANDGESEQGSVH